jgi:hypothetical protein
MDRNILTLVGIVVVIGLVSAALTYWRAENLSTPENIAAKGLAAIQRDTAVFYGFMAVVVGVISWFVYRGMLAQSPDSAASNFLLLAVGIGVALTVLAAVVFKMRGFSELLFLHVVYAAGFGWVLPRLLAF